MVLKRRMPSLTPRPRCTKSLCCSSRELDHLQEEQIGSMSGVVGAGVSPDEIAQETPGSRIQQQAGGEMPVLVPGIEEDQAGSPGEDVFGAGEEFAHIGRQRHASQEFGPQAAVCRGEKRALFHPERGRRLSRLAFETRWHGLVRRKGVVVVAISAVSSAAGRARRGRWPSTWWRESGAPPPPMLPQNSGEESSPERG